MYFFLNRIEGYSFDPIFILYYFNQLILLSTIELVCSYLAQ
jgi:hypothetical protein